MTAQPATVRVEDGAVHLRVPGVGFIAGRPLGYLKDGQSVRVDLSVRVTTKAGGPPAAEARQRCLVSYDLWEERFAVAIANRSQPLVSHVSAADAEAWCLERVTFPVAALARPGDPFFVRVEYQVVDDEPGDAADANAGITLRGLVERLSRRRAADQSRGTIEFGPLRLPAVK